MDPAALAGMVFTIILVAMVGGFILLIPISRRLGAVLEVWLQERRETSSLGTEARETRALLGAVAKRLQAIEEKQGFVEELLSEGEGAGRMHGGSHEVTAPEDS